LLPSQPMLNNLPTNSPNPNPPNSNKHFNIKEKWLLDVLETPIVSTHKMMGVFFHVWTTYNWMEIHQVLSIVMTLYTLITIKVVVANVLS